MNRYEATSRSFSLLTLLLLVIGTPANAQLRVNGVVRAEDDVVMLSEINGIVEPVLVDEGARVGQDEVLVELSNENGRG